MMRFGRAYELPMLALRIAGSGCSSWPTLDAALFNDGQTVEAYETRKIRERAKGYNGNGGGTPLAMMVRLWPTPDVGMATGSRTLPPGTTATGIRPDGRKAQVGLGNAVKVSAWPTPTAGDAKASESAGYSTGHAGTTLTDATVRRTWATPATRDHNGPDAIERQGSPSLPSQNQQGKLNPAWVEQLMGFPDGWTDVGPPARTSRKKPGKRLAQSKAGQVEPQG